MTTGTKHISLRLDDQTKEALETCLDRDGVGAKRGESGRGISQLFRELTSLYLDGEMISNWEDSEWRSDGAKTAQRALRMAEGKFASSGRSGFGAEDIGELKTLLEAMLEELRNSPGLTRFQELEYQSLIGRCAGLLYSLGALETPERE